MYGKGWFTKKARERERYKERRKCEYYNRKVITVLRAEGRIKHDLTEY